MRRLLVLWCLWSAAASADTGFAPPLLEARLTGGVTALHDSSFLMVEGLQARTSSLSRRFPTPTFRLDAAVWPLRFLGVEAEGSAEVFTSRLEGDDAVSVTSARGFVRGAAALRWVSAGGFSLSGALGYGASWAPVVHYQHASEPAAAALRSHGLAVRVGVGLTHDRFDGSLSLGALLPVDTRLVAPSFDARALEVRVASLEPRLWAGARVLDLPAGLAVWVGVDAGYLLELGLPASASAYRGTRSPVASALRAGLSVRLTATPRAPPAVAVASVAEEGAGVLLVRVLLADGGPAVGAQVVLDGQPAVSLDERGEHRLEGEGLRRARATLSGYREVSGEAEVRRGEKTVLTLSLSPLTGPGRLRGVVSASGSGAALAEATVSAEGQEVRTGADGAYAFAALGPGPVQVRVEAQGFVPAEEVVQVPPEAEVVLSASLEPLGKGSPATVRGLVRAQSGKALKARVRWSGGKKKQQVVPVDAEGRFVLTLRAGEYSFVISAPGYIPQTKQVSLADGEQAIFHCELLETR